MDLTTFKKSITDYSTLEDALFALRLIWRNCLEYNVEGSDIASAAIELGHEAEQLIEVREFAFLSLIFFMYVQFRKNSESHFATNRGICIERRNQLLSTTR